MMKTISDQHYLLTEQYAKADKLSARARLHAHFSTNRYGWMLWVFDHFDLPPECTILELGCGSGTLWKQNEHKLNPNWKITLSDFSAGMLAEAQKRLSDKPAHFTFEVIDAQSIPWVDNSFDCLIANHMLYHVPDVNQALSEIARVMKPTGRFYAATIGANHMRELDSIVARFVPGYQKPIMSFSLENGAELLKQHFDHIALDRYEDSLVVSEVQPLYDYICSMIGLADLDHERLPQLRHYLTKEISQHGEIVINKDTGMFTARGIKSD
jgi:ubiquinone/menaquinone biosynthesis C-methylase UbiE